MKKNDTIKITTGAMFVAIFTLILIINRYSGAMFEELIMYILPIPMVAYSAKFGFKSGLPVLAAMVGMSVIFGTFTTIFYAGTEAFIGLVFGSRIYRKADMTVTIALVIVLSVIANVLNTIVLASLFGYNIAEEVAYLQDSMNKAFDIMAEMPSMASRMDVLNAMRTMITTPYLTRIYIISMIILGIVQGYLVYVISLLILNRLRFQLPKPKGILAFYPPKWTGFLAGLLFLGYCYSSLLSDQYAWLKDSVQTAGMCGYLYLVAFGMAGVVLLMRRYVTNNRILPMVVAFFGMMMLPQIEMLIGIVYICTDFHKDKIEEMQQMAAAQQAGPGKGSSRNDSNRNDGRPALMDRSGENPYAAGKNPYAAGKKQNGSGYNGSSSRSGSGKKSMREKSMLVNTLLVQNEEQQSGQNNQTGGGQTEEKTGAAEKTKE